MQATCPSCGNTFTCDDESARRFCDACIAAAGQATDALPVDGGKGEGHGAGEHSTNVMSHVPSPSEIEARIEAARGARPADDETTASMTKLFSRYEILGELGRGGMGIVQKAYDPKLKRVVALKVLLAGEDASADEVERFFREAEAAAKLNHPNIVPIHELDIHEGKHFFTMDYVEGRPLSQVIREDKLTPRRAVEILRDVAIAVHHAHSQGVIHRDIKPANIIMASTEGQGDGGVGRPMVTDFGLAKQVTSQSSLTQSGRALGTPSYMAPEQARGRWKDVDARTDVYALGAVLYEMLTELPPFVGATPFEIMEKVAYHDPIPPRTYSARIPLDVETICMKCLEKVRVRRYGSALELADDCSRFLNGEAISARPASMIYRVRKRVARHKAVAIVAGAAACILAVASVLYVRSLQSALSRARQSAEGERRARIAEESERALAQARLYAANIGMASMYWEQASASRMGGKLGTCTPGMRHWEWSWLKKLMHLEAVCIRGEWFPRCVAAHPDGAHIAAGTGDGSVRLWTTTTRNVAASARPFRETVTALAFDSSGSSLACADGRGSVVILAFPSLEETCRLSLRKAPNEIRAAGGTARFSFCGPGALYGVLSPNGIDLHNRLRMREDIDLRTTAPKHSDSLIAAGTAGADAYVLGEDRAPLLITTGHGDTIVNTTLSEDGECLAIAYLSGVVQIWRTASPQILGSFTASGTPLLTRLDPSGEKTLVICRDSRALNLYSLTRKQAIVIRGHRDFIRACAFSASGDRLISADISEIRVWEPSPMPGVDLLAPKSYARQLEFSHGDQCLLSVTRGMRGELWEVADKTRRAVLAEPVRSAVWRGDTPQILGLKPTGELLLFDSTTGSALAQIGRHEGGHTVCSDGAGNFALTAGRDSSVILWDIEERTMAGAVPVNATWVCFSPDGRLFGTAGRKSRANVFETATCTRKWQLRAHHYGETCLAFSHDGTRIATAGVDSSVKVWRVADFRLLSSADLSNGVLNFDCAPVYFSRDDRRIFCATKWGVSIVDPQTGDETLSLAPRANGPGALALSRTELALAAALEDGSIGLFKTDPWTDPLESWPPIMPPGDTRSAIAYWSFDDGSPELVLDRSGSRWHGQASNCRRVEGVSGQAISLQQRDARVTFPRRRDFVGESFTLSLWIRAHAPRHFSSILADGNGWKTGEWEFRDNWGGANGLLFCRRGHNSIGTAEDPFDGEWHHAAIVCDRSSNFIVMYLDGEFQNAMPLSTGAQTDYSDLLLRLGSRANGGEPFLGDVDEILILGFAAPPQHIRELARSTYYVEEGEYVREEADEEDLVKQVNALRTPWHLGKPQPMRTAEGSAATLKNFLTADCPVWDDPIRDELRYAAGPEWRIVRSAPGSFVDLGKAHGEMKYVVAVARCWIESAKEQDFTFSVGSDDSIAVRINGNEVFRKHVTRGASPGQDTFGAVLRRGTNEIVVKTAQATGGWGFYFEVVDPEGWTKAVPGPRP